MTTTTDQDEIDRISAAAQLIARTGAAAFELRYSEPDTGQNVPTIAWIAIVAYPGDRWDVAAGTTPRHACERLLEQLLDGNGACQHCGKVTTVLHELGDKAPLEGLCIYQYDPESRTYYRGCEHGG